MPGRIVLFGATGYTGGLAAAALAARGARPVLAGRDEARLSELARELDGLETAVADVRQPDSLRTLVGRGDVLVTTVGPFMRWGRVGVEAAIAAGAVYIDSTGEAPFVREVFERHGPAAARQGCGLVTAFGYDYVPGNLAGGLALREAGDAATRVDIGYFTTGGRAGFSGGTRASALEAALEPAFGWRAGRLVTERPGRRVQRFPVDGRHRSAVSIGASEHFTLPALAPQLREVNVHLGWFGAFSRPMQAISAMSAVLSKIPVPGATRARRAVVRRLARGSTGGPDAAARAGSALSHVVAVACDESGSPLAEVVLKGPNMYELTAEILAWGAVRASEAGVQGTGALGPVQAFGLEALERGCSEAGLRAA